MGEIVTVGPHDALLVVDVQYDFCPEGKLAVPDGDAVVPLCNLLMPRFAVVVASQDWHPPGHHSFASTHGAEPFSTMEDAQGRDQILWPEHCLQGSAGAELHRDLDRRPIQLILRKGMDLRADSYSAFRDNQAGSDTGLAGYLRARGVRRVFVTGLALDVCVRFTAEDARHEGFDTVLVRDATRAVNATPGSGEQALAELKKMGVALIDSDQLEG